MLRKSVSLLLILTIFPVAILFAETIDVQIKGLDDGIKSSKQKDYQEAVLFAKREAIERAGVKIESITQVQDLVINKDYIEMISNAVLLPGFNIIDVGYTEDGYYSVVLIGKVKIAEKQVDSSKEDVDVVLIEDQFTDNMNGWKENSRAIIEKGKYVLSTQREDEYLSSVIPVGLSEEQDFIIEANFKVVYEKGHFPGQPKVTPSLYGIIIGSTTKNSSGAGGSALVIERKKFSYQSKNNLVIGYTRHNDLNMYNFGSARVIPGNPKGTKESRYARNELVVIKRGQQIFFYGNNAKLGSANFDRLDGEYFGVFCKGQIKVEIDKFKVTKLGLKTKFNPLNPKPNIIPLRVKLKYDPPLWTVKKGNVNINLYIDGEQVYEDYFRHGTNDLDEVVFMTQLKKGVHSISIDGGCWSPYGNKTKYLKKYEKNITLEKPTQIYIILSGARGPVTGYCSAKIESVTHSIFTPK